MPILAALYPYMVMLGVDKATMPIGFQAIETLGYDPVHIVMGFFFNDSVGAYIYTLAIHVSIPI